MMHSGPYVSVIIPTRNRYELTEFTLLSLFDQSVPAASFEVIVVDDGSEDGTWEVLSRLETPYRLKLIRNEGSHGASRARNIGLGKAEADLVVFLDEMIVDANFIRDTVRHHRQRPNLVLTTAFNGQHIVTHLYPELQVPAPVNSYRERIRKIDGREVVRLFPTGAVRSHLALRYCRPVEEVRGPFRALQRAYGKGLERMAAPWFLMVTNGVSLRRTLLEKVGGFDEDFDGAWLEDWELGYRLHRAGAVFANAPDLWCCHQAHPQSRAEMRVRNYLRFSSKFPEPEVILVGVMGPPLYWPLDRWGKVVTQLKEIAESGLYDEWSAAFFLLGLRLRQFLAGEKTGQERWTAGALEAVSLQWKKLRGMDRYREAADAFGELLGVLGQLKEGARWRD